MKKYLSLVLAVVLALAMTATVFAADTLAPSSGDASQDVTAGYTKPEDIDGGKVYSVTLTWNTDNTLTYTGKNSTYNWSVDDLKYVETVNNSTAIGWAGSATYTITVTNKSNADITATTAATNTYKLTLTAPASETQTVPSAAVTADDEAINYTDTDKVGTAQTATFEYKYEAVASADPITEAASGSVVIDHVTVTISTVD